MPIIMPGRDGVYQDGFGAGPNPTGTFGDFETGDFSQFSGSTAGKSIISGSNVLDGVFSCQIGTSTTWLYGGNDIADQKASLHYDNTSGSFSIGLAVRYQDSNNFYSFRYGGNGDLALGKMIAGNPTVLATATNNGLDSGYYMTLEANGTSLTAQIINPDGVTVEESITATDSDLSTGFVGYGGSPVYAGGTANSDNHIGDNVAQLSV